MSATDVAVAFIVREKLSVAFAALDALCSHTPRPFTLYLLRTAYSDAQTEAMIARASQCARVITVSTPGFILPSQALNLVCDRASEGYICVVENDVLVEPEYLTKMLSVAQQTRCSFVTPRILEGYTTGIHFDPPVSFIERRNGELSSTLVRNPRPGFPPIETIRRVYHLEKHCFLARTADLRALGPFEPFLTTGSHYDLAYRAFCANQVIYLTPHARVRFIAGPITASDQALFSWRWNLKRAESSNEYLRKKWNVRDFKSTVPFVKTWLAAGKSNA